MKLTDGQKRELEWLYLLHSGCSKYVFVPMTDVLDILGVAYKVTDDALTVTNADHIRTELFKTKEDAEGVESNEMQKVLFMRVSNRS